MVDKKKELPVFDRDDERYQKHKKIETSRDHCTFLYNNGLAPNAPYSGILGTESCNSLIDQYVILIFFLYKCT